MAGFRSVKTLRPNGAGPNTKGPHYERTGRAPTKGTHSELCFSASGHVSCVTVHQEDQDHDSMKRCQSLKGEQCSKSIVFSFMHVWHSHAETHRLTAESNRERKHLYRNLAPVVLSPVSTTRVHGPSWRPVNSGAFFDTRVDGPSWRVSKMHQSSRAVNSGRQLG